MSFLDIFKRNKQPSEHDGSFGTAESAEFEQIVKKIGQEQAGTAWTVSLEQDSPRATQNSLLRF